MPENERSAPSRPTQSSAPAPSTTEQQLSAAMAALAESNARIAALMEKQSEYNAEALRISPRRRKTLAEYLKEKPRKRLLHEVYQNGRLVNPAGLSIETIKKLDGLATGKYADGMVDVMRIKDGVDGIATRIHIFYRNRSLEQRMLFYMKFPTFTAIVNAIANEMAALGIEPVVDKIADPPEDDAADSK